MSIFVDPDERIEIVVHYTDTDDVIEILEQPSKHCKTLKALFKRPDFELSQRMLATHTRITPTGEQTINFVQLQNALIYELGVEWDHKDDEDKEIPMSSENISRLRIEMARAIVTALVEKAGTIL